MGEDLITVAERGVLELPFTFRPLDMKQAAAYIVVEVVQEGSEVDGVKWQFPVKGMSFGQLIESDIDCLRVLCLSMLS